MKIMGRTTDFCGTKEKRAENETMISMWKKANAFFFPFLPFANNMQRSENKTDSFGKSY
jgi:hypothetical protein